VDPCQLKSSQKGTRTQLSVRALLHFVFFGAHQGQFISFFFFEHSAGNDVSWLMVRTSDAIEQEWHMQQICKDAI